MEDCSAEALVSVVLGGVFVTAIVPGVRRWVGELMDGDA